MEKVLDWMKNHKVLTGFLAVLIAAVLVLIILICVNKNYIEFFIELTNE